MFSLTDQLRIKFSQMNNYCNKTKAQLCLKEQHDKFIGTNYHAIKRLQNHKVINAQNRNQLIERRPVLGRRDTPAKQRHFTPSHTAKASTY